MLDSPVMPAPHSAIRVPFLLALTACLALGVAAAAPAAEAPPSSRFT